jgi:hypothetical protein
MGKNNLLLILIGLLFLVLSGISFFVYKKYTHMIDNISKQFAQYEISIKQRFEMIDSKFEELNKMNFFAELKDLNEDSLEEAEEVGDKLDTIIEETEELDETDTEDEDDIDLFMENMYQEDDTKEVIDEEVDVADFEEIIETEEVVKEVIDDVIKDVVETDTVDEDEEYEDKDEGVEDDYKIVKEIVCDFIMVKGKNKGKPCGNKVVRDTTRCKRHKK